MKLNQSVTEEQAIVYGFYMEFMDRVQSHNNAQIFYKGLVSTLLLGCFVGVGYVFTSIEPTTFYGPLAFVFLICLGGSLLLGLIWYLDLVEQERQIADDVLNSICLESTHEYVPKFFTNVKNAGSLYGYIGRKSIFYAGCLLIFVLSGSCSVGVLLQEKGFYHWAITSLLLSLIWIGLSILLTSRISLKSNPYQKD